MFQKYVFVLFLSMTALADSDEILLPVSRLEQTVLRETSPHDVSNLEARFRRECDYRSTQSIEKNPVLDECLLADLLSEYQKSYSQIAQLAADQEITFAFEKAGMSDLIGGYIELAWTSLDVDSAIIKPMVNLLLLRNAIYSEFSKQKNYLDTQTHPGMYAAKRKMFGATLAFFGGHSKFSRAVTVVNHLSCNFNATAKLYADLECESFRSKLLKNLRSKSAAIESTLKNQSDLAVIEGDPSLNPAAPLGRAFKVSHEVYDRAIDLSPSEVLAWVKEESFCKSVNKKVKSLCRTLQEQVMTPKSMTDSIFGKALIASVLVGDYKRSVEALRKIKIQKANEIASPESDPVLNELQAAIDVEYLEISKHLIEYFETLTPQAVEAPVQE